MYYPSFNIGIEEEYQLIDPDSRELLGYVTQSMAREKMVVNERAPSADLATLIREGAVSTGTPVCMDINEARDMLLRVREQMLELGVAGGFKIAGAGTHPFSRWEGREEMLAQYRQMAEDVQVIARRILAFGLRIHIGVEDRDLAIDVMNTLRYVLPHIFCLSTSSPFWQGRNTGLKSYRAVLVDSLPRTGIPGAFSSYHDYRLYVDTLMRTNSIPDPRRIMYDVVPHYRFPTLVIRICDMMPSYRDVLAVTALIQASVAWMVDLRQRNLSFRLYDRTLIAENKWRAVRYGLDGNLVDFGVEQQVPARELISELLDRIEPVARKLSSWHELEHCYTILARGSSSDQQLAVWAEHGEDARAVVDFLVAETENLA
ncbi:carboxylate-amine ligase [Caldilinea sp.]|uniref:carboxylate-amine ligase n=1 Tax=Caldilinea sp. TaxID=2293560 RepID=UPI002CCE9AEB|nr:carboxylate-amine ligase [Anaerolineales bacterium]HQY91498.1 carboxylate-amine ligase [Caldilinea sp.]